MAGEASRAKEFQRGTAGVPESVKEGATGLHEGSDIGLGARCREFESPHSDHIERDPFFEHFYRKTDLSFFESLATAGLFLFVFFQYFLEKTENAEELFFCKVGI